MNAMTTMASATLVGVMLCVLPAAAAPQRGRAPSADISTPVFERPRTPASLGLHGFSVVLVIGGPQVGGATEGVPEAARKALNDMKDFLPYKRYQLLDAAWMLCCGPARAGIVGQVRGPEGRDYQYGIDTLGVADNKLNLRFTMRETQEAVLGIAGQGRLTEAARLEHSRQLYDAIRDLDEAEIAQRSAQKRVDVGIAAAPEAEAATTRVRRAQQRVQDLKGVASNTPAGQSRGRGQGGTTASTRTVMDSTFSIALGETVVIGTSRIMGDQALIAILTAASKPGASR